jgi:hypothetical protein
MIRQAAHMVVIEQDCRINNTVTATHCDQVSDGETWQENGKPYASFFGISVLAAIQFPDVSANEAKR